MGFVHGVGYNDGKYPSRINGRITKEYSVWRSMIGRCYHRTDNRKLAYKSYDSCTVSENFKNYSYFYEWCQKQIGFGLDNFDMDKDLYSIGNCLYSEDTCVFVPKEVNTLISQDRINKGKYPTGVSFHNQTGRFASRLKKFGKEFFIGLYDTPEEAFAAYKSEKESHIKLIANMNKERISERVYNCLMQYEVNE